MMKSCTELKPASRRLARIRCLDECIKCLQQSRPLPECLCYVPNEIHYSLNKTTKLKLYSFDGNEKKELLTFLIFVPNVPGKSPVTSDGKLQAETKPHTIVTSGEELCDSQGQWARFVRHVKPSGDSEVHGCESKAWLLLYSHQNPEENLGLTALTEKQTVTAKELVYGVNPPLVQSWETLVEYTYALHIVKTLNISPSDTSAMEKLCSVPANWTLDHDEDLAQFLNHHLQSDNDHLGSIKNYVENIKVSSSSEEDEGPENLTDSDPETYWESDGSQGDHCITLFMKKGTIVQQLLAVIDSNDDNYMPQRFIVKGGESGNMKQISNVQVDSNVYGLTDILVLENPNEHYPIIEIWIKECKDDGIDTRIHGIKLKSTKERDLGLNKDLFCTENLVRFPKLEVYDPEILYRRAIMLQRLVTLLDSVLPYIVPAWEYSENSVTSLEVLRQILPLSKKRIALIDKFLRESENGQRLSLKRLYINRRAASDHKTDPSKDPESKNSVFYQVYEGLKPRDRTEKPLDYRWSSRFDQWWETKFIGEGIIDQGGGFRDSLSDIAEELCPSANDVPVPLRYFIRSPNQNMADSNVNQDMYIPNPSCTDFARYEWIGKLMGACFRGKENLVLLLPQFVWKKLSEERVTWLRDYITVDEAEVRIIDHLSSMSEAEFEAYTLSGERTWTTMLSDGTVTALKPGDQHSAETPVEYTDRHEYCQLVQAMRMSEADRQIAAIRRGFLQVIPRAVVDLLTWQELERRVCGCPEISIEALRRATHYEDLEDDDTQVRYLWEALTEFSNEDRSRFLRFVTGRRRLPTPIYVCLGKGVDSLPESSTCSHTLYLPNYSSAKVATEKLRYACYNCIAIDTDMSPWET